MRDQAMKERIQERLERAVSEKVFPGCVAGIIQNRTDKEIIPVGRLTFEDFSPVVHDETIYDIASVTKAIPVSSLALSLIDSGKLKLHEPVKQYLPDLNTNYAEEITPWHLLTHTLDYRLSLSSLKDKGTDHIVHEVFTRKFTSRPGERMNYSNATSILLGRVIEEVSGKTLDSLADELFFTPLEMHHTTFHPETFENEQIAPTEYDPWRSRIIQGEIHDESAYLLREKFIAGSAGVFSTASDLLQFLHMLLQEGVFKKKTYFSKRMIQEMQENQLSDLGESVSLGWELQQPRYMGDFASEYTFGKTGFTGCVVMVDIPKGRALVLLSNYHYPTRKESVAKLNEVRRDVANIVFTTE